MLELHLYSKESYELVKTCKIPFVPWNVTRYCASLVGNDGRFKNEIYNEEPMQLYEDLAIKLFSHEVEKDVFEKYFVEGKEVVKIGKEIVESCKNQDSKN